MYKYLHNSMPIIFNGVEILVLFKKIVLNVKKIHFFKTL